MVGGKIISAVGAAVAALMLISPAVRAQYPGQVAKKTKDTPVLRAIGVLEWTGDIGKPKACRLVPITIYDGQKLQDASIYMARPQPLALSGEVEYQLKQNGKTVGLFDIENAGQEQGTWVGFGKWKALPKPKAPSPPPKIDAGDDPYSDKPVLHRKHHAGDSAGSKSGNSTASSSQPAAPDDPDRPRLHQHSEETDSSTASEAPAPDPDRPILKEPKPEKAPPDNAGKPAGAAGQPGGGQISPQLAGDIGDVSSVDSSDPDRPVLKPGKPAGIGSGLAPTLMGLPPDMKQQVAVSDAKNTPDHVWTYSWANPEDEEKMKAEVEEIAREALGLTTTKPEATSKSKKSSARSHRTAKAPELPPEPAPLEDEQFRVFELAYGSGATMVLTAHTRGPVDKRKFVTIVAQPDLYGNVRVLMKSVTDVAHLDETPRMSLVDAVDALGDNRGELLFELRGVGSRQFALYRVYRGTIEKLFVTGGGVYGSISSN